MQFVWQQKRCVQIGRARKKISAFGVAWAIPLVLCGAVACTGSIESPGLEKAGSGGRASDDIRASDDRVAEVVNPENASEKLDCSALSPGRAPVRRLSHEEYKNTVGDLLGLRDEAQKLVAGFASESQSLGFRNNADFLTVPQLAAEQYEAAAEELSERAAQDSDLVACDGDAEACAATFIADFGLRAFRRPLSADEQARYGALFAKAHSDFDYAAGVEWVVNAMLQSPHFLFRAEFGRGGQDGVSKPTDYEMASRLSYMFWRSMPDEKLFEAARRGELRTPSEIEEQAERLLADPRAERSLEFYSQWLDADTLPSVERDEKAFPGLAKNLAEHWAGEFRAFTRHLVFETDGTLEDLFTAPYTFADETLAEHYGLKGGFGAAYEKVEREGASGFLTLPGFLVVHDKPTRTSIVGRGLKVRTDIMCDVVPAAPDDVELDLGAIQGDLTQRERLEQHREEPACAACHNLIDPLGVVFEGFDAVGRQRSMDEDDLPVETQSEITLSGALNGVVRGPQELGRRFAQSPEIRSCFVNQGFRFFHGRDYTEEDLCSRARISAAFEESGHDLKKMLIAMTQTDAFLYMPQVVPEVSQ